MAAGFSFDFTRLKHRLSERERSWVTFAPFGTQSSVLGIVCNIVQWLFYFSIPIGLAMLLYSAYLFLTSGGDRNKVSNARTALFATVIGWVVLFLVTLLPRIIAQLLGLDTSTLPSPC